MLLLLYVPGVLDDSHAAMISHSNEIPWFIQIEVIELCIEPYLAEQQTKLAPASC